MFFVSTLISPLFSNHVIGSRTSFVRQRGGLGLPYFPSLPMTWDSLSPLSLNVGNLILTGRQLSRPVGLQSCVLTSDLLIYGTSIRGRRKTREGSLGALFRVGLRLHVPLDNHIWYVYSEDPVFLTIFFHSPLDLSFVFCRSCFYVTREFYHV